MSGGRVDFKAKLKAAGTERMTMLEQSLERVKKHLRESPEYRTRTVPELVKKAYREVLGREPDPQGFEAYRKQMLQQDMSYEALVSRLRDSDEYRNRNKSKP